MDWQSIIIKIVSALLATLGAWVLAKVKSLINTKIKNEKARNLLQGATNVVSNAVKATYQTYVESIKGTDAWTKDAQEEALKLAIAAARMQLSADVEKIYKRQLRRRRNVDKVANRGNALRLEKQAFGGTK